MKASQDNHFMILALEQASQAARDNEVPIGAVLVDGDNNIVCSARNAALAMNDPTAHAEILAIRRGANILNNYRLLNCTLYVTLEPCAMCAGAMIWARLKRVVFGAYDPKAGALGSVLSLQHEARFNHRLIVDGEVLAAESIALLQSFFKQRRKQ